MFRPAGGGVSTEEVGTQITDRMAAGTLAARPSAASFGVGLYYATNDNGGTLYRSDGAAWTAVAQNGIDLAYAESTATHTTASLAAGAAEDIAGLAITFVAPVRPVLLEAGNFVTQAVTAAARPELQITDNANAVVARHRYHSDQATLKPGQYARRRLSNLTPGQSYTFKARIGNATGGTASIIAFNAAADAPSYLSAKLA